ncbi:DUF1453 domain-containing protein [Kitasatospora sp. NPDC058965]|uniref:DUF1453 domain-containing protein n=1 Tax=Kitasatospora sp. NPDC058965 TaxID=3346682 RepID=UPI003699749B
MTGLVNILAILAVTALVVSRQFQARKLNTDRRFWLLPLILAAVALHGPSLIDPKHQAAAIALLVVSALVVMAMGSVWGWTVRLWRDSEGSVWAKGTKATVAAWTGLIVVRIGLYGLGTGLHIHQSSNALLLTLGVLLLTRGVVVNWRARSLDAPQPLTVAG